METMAAPRRSGGTEPGEHGASPPDTAAPAPGSARARIRMWAILIVGALLLAVIAALTLWSRPAPVHRKLRRVVYRRLLGKDIDGEM